MQPRRRYLSLAAALAAIALPVLVLGVLQTSVSGARVVAPGIGPAGAKSPTSPTGRGTHAGRTHAEPPGEGVRPRGPRRRHRHAARKARLTSLAGDVRSIETGARKALDASVTIADFSFTPATITVHVGDTVVWHNNGPSDHTATANNGSFNTGVLSKGKSASVTFHLPGTFGYHCSIHPFMHGTVVVLAGGKTPSSSGSGSSGSSGSSGNSGSSGGSGGSGTSGSSGSSTGSSGSSAGSGGSSGSSANGGGTGSTGSSSGQGSLPFTGVNVLEIVALGLSLGGVGLLLHGLRRRRLG